MIRYKYWKQYCKTFIVAAVCFFLQVNSCLLAQEVMRLPRSTPASQGVSAAGKSASHSIAPQINGKTFNIAANDAHIQQVSFAFRDNRCQLTLKDDRARYRFDCGLLKWVEGTTQMPGTPPQLTGIAKNDKAELPPAKVAASYSWKDSVTLEIICRYIESPHKEVITCHFNKQAVTLDFHGSLTAMAPQAGKRPALKGVLAGRKVFL